MIYFDHNATTPMLPVARQAWLDAVEKFVGNPSSPHRIGSRADAAIASVRQRLADILGCDALDLVWTSGATESNNTVLHHFARTLPSDAEVWVSAIEHPCVMASTKHYFPKRHRLIPVTREGVVNLNWLTEEMAHSMSPTGKGGLATRFVSCRTDRATRYDAMRTGRPASKRGSTSTSGSGRSIA